MDYLTFRSRALQSVTLACSNGSKKQKIIPNHWSKDDIEDWIKAEYEKHYGKKEVAA